MALEKDQESTTALTFSCSPQSESRIISGNAIRHATSCHRGSSCTSQGPILRAQATYMHACVWRDCLPASLCACMHACIPACLRACAPGVRLARPGEPVLPPSSWWMKLDGECPISLAPLADPRRLASAQRPKITVPQRAIPKQGSEKRVTFK